MTLQNSSGEQPAAEIEGSEDVHTGGDSGGASRFAQALASHMQADEESADDDSTGEPGESQPKGKPKDLADIAARLGVEVSDIYEAVIPVGQGREALTIGKLKDQAAAFASLDTDRLAWSEEKVRQESELTTARQELQELLTTIPRESLNKEAIQRAAVRVHERNKALEAQVVSALGWQNPAVRDEQMGAMSRSLAGYGFAAAEVKAIRDPRLVKFIRDAVRREEQVRKALADVKPVEKKAKPASNNRGPANLNRPEQQPKTLRPSSTRERFSAELNKHR